MLAHVSLDCPLETVNVFIVEIDSSPSTLAKPGKDGEVQQTDRQLLPGEDGQAAK